MAWNYTAKDATPGLPDGDYEATIKKVEDTVSKAENAMRVITFTVYDKTSESTIKDYFVEGNRFAMFRMKRIAQAIGKAAEFESGKFDVEKHVGATLTVTIETDDKGFNKILEFKTLQRTTRSPAAAALAGQSPPAGEEDIPF